jgi:hypothetical protein
MEIFRFSQFLTGQQCYLVITHYVLEDQNNENKSVTVFVQFFLGRPNFPNLSPFMSIASQARSGAPGPRYGSPVAGESASSMIAHRRTF